MEKIDFKKTLKHLYQPPNNPVLVDVPQMNFLKIDGVGNPNTSDEYAAALEALYGLAYTLKFAIKKSAGVDFAVYPLEGLWWADDMDAFLSGDRDQWQWTMMIAQPDFVTSAQVEAAAADLTRKKAPSALPLVRFEPYAEGLAAQMMHWGPYSEEGPNIQRLHAFIAGQGYQLRGLHHEIYLGDPRRTAPEKLRTVLRQPVGQN